MFMEAGDPMICYLQAGEPGKLSGGVQSEFQGLEMRSQWYKSQSES